MKIAVLADIHGNLEALQACLAHAGQEGAGMHAFLGDLAGYGADPVACLGLLADYAAKGALLVRGNHDEAALGGLCENMNFVAREATCWTRKQLSSGARDAFGDYVENMLENDAKRELAVVASRCKERGLANESAMRFSNPAETVLAIAGEIGADFVVIGSPRKKGEEGLNSRMELEKLVRGLKCPLLIAPHP